MKPLKRGQEGTVSKKVREALETDAYVKHAIRLGIANYSAIADNLSKKIGGSEDALKMAVLRFAKTLERTGMEQEGSIRKVLSETKIALLSNICVLIFDRTQETEKAVASIDTAQNEIYSILASQKVLLLITHDEHEKLLVHKVGRQNLVKKRGGLCMLRLTSPPQIEYVAGVIAYMLDRLAEHGINFTDLYSCYTDTNLVVERKDALKAFELLEQMCKDNPEGKEGE